MHTRSYNVHPTFRFVRGISARNLICFALVLTSLFSRAQPPPEIAKLSSAYNKGLTKIAADYDASLGSLAENYVLELKKLSLRMKAQKDKPGMAAVRTEALRYMKALSAEPDPFETVPELTDENLVKEPEALRLIQQSYVSSRTARELSRNESVVDLTKKLLGGLDKMQANAADAPDAAAAFRKEAVRIRVAMQRKDFPVRALKSAKVTFRMLPPAPDPARVQERVQETKAKPLGGNAMAANLTELPAPVQAFLLKPLDYDKSWPPEVTNWKFEGCGNYSHDFYLYNLPDLPAELAIFPYPKNMKAFLRGTMLRTSSSVGSRTVFWTGKAMAWRLNDSRDLVCNILFHTQRPALSEAGGPAACVAVYSIDEGDKLIASYSVPMLEKDTELYVAKHYSYNRMNIKWVGTKRKRGFTLPDHTPLRVVVGIVGYAKGEEIEATIEILPARQAEDR